MKTGRLLNLSSPTTFDEKLLWLMLYWRHPLKTRCADKYEMRGYVKEQGFNKILPKLLGVYENSGEINYDILPRRFVLKCTHGCGFNLVCEDKETFDKMSANEQLDKWMKIDFSKVYGEIHYAKMTPRIICEEFLDDLGRGLPCDFKVYCFSGMAHCIMTCTERSLNRGAKYHIYDKKWKYKLSYFKTRMLVDKGISKPESYEEIIFTAEKLSKPFPFVRMDFYSINGKAVLGEMTFTPAGCIDPDYTDDAQKILGDMIALPAKVLE